MAKSFSIIIPVFNEEKNLKNFLDSLSKYYQYIIIVNDGSTDRTAKILSAYNLKVVNHQKNSGKGEAMKTGVIEAQKRNSDFVIFMDADGQHRAEDIQQFTGNFDKGYDLVFGSRQYQTPPPFIKNFGKFMVTKLINIIYQTNRTDILCGFFAFKIDQYHLIKWSSFGYGVETEIAIKVAKNQIRFKEVLINSNYPVDKKGIEIKDVLVTVINIPRWIIS